MLDPDLLVIGRQVRTDFGGEIDLLCMDARGHLVAVELKKGRTPREVTAQTLDYASWVKDLSNDEIMTIAERYPRLGGDLTDAFEARFKEPLPETLNQNHRSLIVAEAMDDSTERIVRYLTDLGVPINVATVQHFTTADGKGVLAQVFLVAPDEAATKVPRGSGRRYHLTQPEFQRAAEAAGVGNVYARLSERARAIMPRGPIGSTVSYKVTLEGRNPTAILVTPWASDKSNGLKFSLNSNRLIKYFGLSQEQLAAILPPSSEEIMGASPWPGAVAGGTERVGGRSPASSAHARRGGCASSTASRGQDQRVQSDG